MGMIEDARICTVQSTKGGEELYGNFKVGASAKYYFSATLVPIF